MEKEIISLLRENSIGKQTAVLDSGYGLYVWRKKLYVMFEFRDFDFSEMKKNHKNIIFKDVKNKKYSFSKSYQG